MVEAFADFHFIRPLLLLTIIPIIVIIIGLMLKNRGADQWTSIIDRHLLAHLLVKQNNIGHSSLPPLVILTLSLLLAVLALAGPTWQKRPLPVFETEISRVILLDLSLSMLATDIKPSRLIRAKHKITDLLTKTREGQVALIVYAGDAFVISPLTTDANTIMTMVPPLSPALMPVLGSEPHRAFILADELLINAGVFSGQIIWITDGIDDRDYGLVAKQLKGSRHQISILAVGTSEGAPIPLLEGQGFLKDAKGGIILPKLNIAPLQQLALMNQGSFTRLTADDQDIDQLLSSLQDPRDFVASDQDLKMDTWVEVGPWLLLPLLIITALAFRKGIVVAIFLLLLPVLPGKIHGAQGNRETNTASGETKAAPIETIITLKRSWKNLWATPNQQAAVSFNNNDPATAADLFEQPDWKSAAMYQSGQFNAASDLLSRSPSVTALYNNGNALAQLGKLEESIAAYEKALQQQPDMEDAIFNKALVEGLLEQQKQQQNQDGEKQQSDSSQQQGDEQDKTNSEDAAQNEEKEQQQSEQQGETQETENKDPQMQQTELEQMNDAEREQVLEQWLRMIKDDPGGLLRRKMYMEYQRRQEQEKNLQQKGEKVW